MAIVIPCIRGKMGNTEFYEAKMPARELVTGVRPASELDKWATMSIEERIQRDPDLGRIQKEIAPYIASTKDRFFGSIIVLVYEGQIYFESIKDLGSKVPVAYRSVSEDIGFVTIDGGSLVVLDGQHRLLALEKVIKNEVTGEYTSEVPNDDVCVLFIQHESNEKTRRIFNKVNRYAKSTSRGDNIITSEDDGYAIIARRLLNDDAPLGVNDSKGEVIVDWKNNSLSARSTKITTISVVYETVKRILTFEGVPKLDPKFRPTDEELDHYYELVERFWKTVLEHLKPYGDALINSSRIPKMREDSEPHSLLFKPAAQIALFDGLATAMGGGRLGLKEAVERANRVDWRMSSEIWRNVIIRPNGTIDVRHEARTRAAHFIAYLIAEDKMTVDEIDAVRLSLDEARGEAGKLPKSVVAKT